MVYTRKKTSTHKGKKDNLSSLTLYHAEELYEDLYKNEEIADVGVEYDRDYVIEISKELLFFKGHVALIFLYAIWLF